MQGRHPYKMILVGTRHRCMLHCSNMTSEPSQETMTERRHRLHQELAKAYATPEDNWRGGRIYRLANEIADVERAIAESRPRDEHTKDLWSEP